MEKMDPFDYDDRMLYMNEEERNAFVFHEYMKTKERDEILTNCYVLIPPGPDYYVPEIDGKDMPPEIEQK